MFVRREDKEPEPLRIEALGNAPMTPEPDEAELAAEAVLEYMSHSRHARKEEPPKPKEGTSEYYEMIADRIRTAHTAAALRTLRFLAYCEQELQRPHLPVSGPASLSLLEVELYKRIDTVEREGGELKRRWQHCLAEVTVRLMNAPAKASQGDIKEDGVATS